MSRFTESRIFCENTAHKQQEVILEHYRRSNGASNLNVNDRQISPSMEIPCLQVDVTVLQTPPAFEFCDAAVKNLLLLPIRTSYIENMSASLTVSNLGDSLSHRDKYSAKTM